MFDIIDTAGQEEYLYESPFFYSNKFALIVLIFHRYISDIYTKISNGFIFVFDVTHKNSLKDVERFYNAVKETRDIEKIPKVLVGNKNDLPNRTVSESEAEEFANSISCDYFDSSAKSFTNIQPIFERIANLVVSIKEEETSKYVDKKKRFCILL